MFTLPYFKSYLLFISTVLALTPTLPVENFARQHRHDDPPISIPPSADPNITILTPQFFFPNLPSQRILIKYGPYTTSSSTLNMGMSSFYTQNATKPCSDCLITWMQAGLEYEDGSDANADTGMWLHHVVLYNLEKKDTLCPEKFPERFFASGNERTEANLCVNGSKEAAYHLSNTSTLLLAPELMNSSPTPRAVYITITYEFIPLPIPAHHKFKHLTPIWLDVTGPCGNSAAIVPPSVSSFNLSMLPPWTSTINGSITFSAGHLHDGGTAVSLTKNNYTVCDSTATYGASKGYVGNELVNMTMPDGTAMEMEMPVKHVSNMSVCAVLGEMRVGEKWGVQARYDFGANEGMKGVDGGWDDVMGIALLYVARG